MYWCSEANASWTVVRKVKMKSTPPWGFISLRSGGSRSANEEQWNWYFREMIWSSGLVRLRLEKFGIGTLPPLVRLFRRIDRFRYDSCCSSQSIILPQSGIVDGLILVGHDDKVPSMNKFSGPDQWPWFSSLVALSIEFSSPTSASLDLIRLLSGDNRKYDSSRGWTHDFPTEAPTKSILNYSSIKKCNVGELVERSKFCPPANSNTAEEKG